MEKLENKPQCTEKPVMPNLRKLAVGESISFPIRKTDSVKTTANKVEVSSIGTNEPKKFKTSINRGEQIITVTRIM